MSILCTCLKFCRPDVPFQKVVQRSLVTKAFWTPGLRNTCELNPTQSTPGFQLLQPQLWTHLAKSGQKYFRRKYSIFYYRYNFKKSKKRHKEQKFCTFQNLFRELCSPIQWVCKQSPKLKNLMNPFPKREWRKGQQKCTTIRMKHTCCCSCLTLFIHLQKAANFFFFTYQLLTFNIQWPYQTPKFFMSTSEVRNNEKNIRNEKIITNLGVFVEDNLC